MKSDSVTFTYVKGAPIDYRQFVLWLFYGNPKLKDKITGRDGDRCTRIFRARAAIETALGVSRGIAVALLKNANHLGFIMFRNATGPEDDGDTAWVVCLVRPDKSTQ